MFCQINDIKLILKENNITSLFGKTFLLLSQIHYLLIAWKMHRVIKQ